MIKKPRSKQIMLNIVLATMVLGMGGFGFSNVLNTVRNTDVIVAGKTRVDMALFDQRYRETLEIQSRTIGQPMSKRDALASGFPQIVLEQLTTDSILLETARRAGWVVPDSLAAQEIMGIEAFQKPDGSFDRETYEAYLSAQNISEADFVSQRINPALLAGVASQEIDQNAPKLPAIENILRDSLGKTQTYLILPLPRDLAVLGAQKNPTVEEIQSRYAQGDYLLEPEREIEMASFLPEKITPSEEEIKSYYDNSDQDLAQPATASYRVLFFPTREEAELIKDKAAFDAIVAERAQTQPVATYENATIPNALASTLDVGQTGIIGPLEDMLGFAVYDVMAHQAGAKPSLDTVRPQIVEHLQKLKVEETLAPEYQKIVDLAAGGADLNALAEETLLDYARLNETDLPQELAQSLEFIEWIETADTDGPMQQINLPTGGIVFAKLANVPEPQKAPLENVQDQIIQELQFEDLAKKRTDLAQNIVSEINQGTDPNTVATKYNITPETTAPLLSTDLVGALPAEIALEARSTRPIGEAWHIETGTEIDYVALISDENNYNPNDQKSVDFATNLTEGITQIAKTEVINAYLKDAQSTFDVRYNEANINRVTGKESK